MISPSILQLVPRCMQPRCMQRVPRCMCTGVDASPEEAETHRGEVSLLHQDAKTGLYSEHESFPDCIQIGH